MATTILKYTDSDDFKNYITLILALELTKDGLREYLSRCTDDLYMRLSNKCAGYIPCDKNCSKQSAKTWCHTCEKWKTEISLFMRHQDHKRRIKWNRFDSCSWGRDSSKETLNQIANLFVYECRDPVEPYYNDIMHMISYLDNCIFFDIGKENELLDKIRTVRNEHFAHNKAATMTECDLQWCLQTCITFLSHPTLKWSDSCKQNITILKQLKDEHKRMNNRTLENVISKFQNPTISEHNDKEVEPLAIQYLQQQTSLKQSSARMKLFSFFGGILTVLLIIVLLYRNFYPNDHDDIPHMKKHDKKDCFSMDFKFPWNSDMEFSYYLGLHDSLIGRRWLLDDLTKVFADPRKRGVLLTAGMGFGKSAILAHIACIAEETSTRVLHNNLVGLHLCRYDAKNTLSPGIFVRNLAGSLANYFQEFGNYIEMDRMASEYLRTEKCFQDPQGCFDFGILKPMQVIQNPERHFLIIIDALDECIEYGDINIYSLLSQRMHRLPQYLKFLLTSRNISKIYANLPHDVVRYNSFENNTRNKDDVREYLELRIYSKMYSNIVDKRSRQEWERIIDTFVNLAEGNFLFVIHALDFSLQSEDFEHIPDSLEHIYRLNLERIFGNKYEKFEKIRSVFEILCASRKSLSKEDIFKILNITDDFAIRELSSILKNELSHFVKKLREKISLSHKRFADFLSSNNSINNEYQVSKQNGHRLIAQNFIKNMELFQTFKHIDIIDTIYHIVNTKNQSIITSFISISRKILEIKSERIACRNILHKAAFRLNSYLGMDLIIKVFSYIEVDKFDEKYNTPSYIATAYGHDQSLKALLDSGADKNFARSNVNIYKLSSPVNFVSFCKYSSFCGYSLLNIASQNGHLDVLKLLLKYGSDVHHKNNLNLNSFEIASEHGHLKILRELVPYNILYNKKLSHALYLASQNGHSHVVKFLLRIGAVDQCVPCNGTSYWIANNQRRMQVVKFRQFQFLHIEFNPKQQYVLNDDRNLLFCETALETAVQNGHLEVVKILLSQNENAFACYEAHGRTPILTAIIYDKLDIFKVLYQSNKSVDHTCSDPRNRNIGSSVMENHHMHINTCPTNASISHIVAMYGRGDIIKYLYHEAGFTKWRLYDPEKATPLHYAACHGNENMMANFLSLGLSLAERTKNGSTAFHSAAICGSFFQIMFVAFHYDIFRIDYTDNSNKNPLHYAFLTRQSEINVPDLDLKQLASGIDLDDKKQLYNKVMYDQDVDGNTPLHYAALAGDTGFLKTDFMKSNLALLFIKNSDNMTVLDLIFNKMKHQRPFDILRIPDKCDFYELFTYKCKVERTQILTGYESFVYVTLEILVSKGQHISGDEMYRYITSSVTKNRIYMLFLLKMYFPRQYESTLLQNRQHFLKSLLEGSYFLPVTSHLLLDYLIPEKCEDILSNSHIRSIFFDEDKKFWPLFSKFSLGNSTYEFNISYLHLSCFEQLQNGLTPVEMGIIGGNEIMLARFVYKDSRAYFNLTTSSRISLFSLVHNAPCVKLSPEFFPDCNMYFELKLYSFKLRYNKNSTIKPYGHPNIVNVLFENRKNELLLSPCSVYCRHMSLSFIHIIAAKGFIKLVHFIYVKYGTSVIQCSNKYNITASQLAFFFNHQYLTIYRVDSIPLEKPEFASLLHKVVMDFRTFVFPKNSVAWKCYSYRHKINRSIREKCFCLGRLHDEILKLYLNSVTIWVNGSFISRTRKYLSAFQQSELNSFRSIPSARIMKYIMNFYNTDYVTKTVSRMYVDKLDKINLQITTRYCLSQWTSNSRQCLDIISRKKKFEREVHEKLQVGSQILFLLAYGLYNEKHTIIPRLAHRETNEIIELMHAYIGAPGFHNIKRFSYWNVLKSPFSDPFRNMVKTILNSSVQDILKWEDRTKIILQYLTRYAHFTDYENAKYDNSLRLYDDLNDGD